MLTTLSALALVAPAASEERVSVSGTVTRVEAGTIHFRTESLKDLQVGDEGEVIYHIRVGGRTIPITAARINVVEVMEDSAVARLFNVKAAVQVGYSVVVRVEPCVGTLVVTTTPPSSTTTIEAGRRITPGAPEKVPCGEVRYRVSAAGYQDREGKLAIERNAAIHLTLDLAPLQGILVLSSTVPGVNVFIDNRHIGVAGEPTGDLKWTAEPGQYRLRALKSGFLPFEKDVALAPGGVLRLDLTLKPDPGARAAAPSDPKPQRCAATLVIRTTPSGASVYVDGVRPVEVTPVVLEGVDCGERRVRVRLPNYEDAEETLRIIDNRAVRLNLTLRRAQAEVVIETSPGGAQVSLDGGTLGTTPLHLPGLPFGTYRLRMEKAGFEPIDQQIIVNERRSIHTFGLTAAAPKELPITISAFGYEGVGGLQAFLSLGLLTSYYAIELDGKLVIDWGIKSREVTVNVIPGDHRLRVLTRHAAVTEPLVHYDRVVSFKDAASNRVAVNFLASKIVVNDVEAFFTTQK